MSQNNRSAGELINQINRRHKFADWTRQKQATLIGLQTGLHIQGGNTSKNQIAAYGAVIEGAQYTTAAEQASYVAEVNDSALPDAPSNVVATAGNGQASISFSIPNNGGLPITSYTITSSPEGITASGTSSPITITGLANGETYTFTVYATNAAGNSASSVASGAITLTGGTLTTTPFTTIGPTTWSAPSLRSVVEYLIVGGGGGGGGGYDTGAGGGGGAGMVLSGTFRSVASATYAIIVGAGGAASTNTYPVIPETAGGAGISSVLDTIIALGGNGGKGSRTQTGGSGAGGAAQTAAAAAIGGNGGGSGGGGGGGGGSSGAGGNKSGATAGVAGAGTSSSISGSAVTYGAGGAGGTGNTIATGAAGTANRGNGGGGGSYSSGGARNGGAGGSGIVIVRYYAQP